MHREQAPTDAPLFPCVCCGYLTVDAPGSYDICPVCLWEDDIVQLRYPMLAGGANPSSLVDAQAFFAATGASHARRTERVRPPAADEYRDAGWRPLNRSLDNFELEPEGPWPSDWTTLYWWRPTYWRMLAGGGGGGSVVAEPGSLSS